MSRFGILLATVILLLGVGCEDPVNIDDACRAYCGALAECQPDVFTTTYDSQTECRDECEYGLRMEQAAWGDCFDEYLEYSVCTNTLSCREREEPAENCPKELERLNLCNGI